MGWNTTKQRIISKSSRELREQLQFVLTVAGWLGETENPQAYYMIRRIIETLGKECVFGLLRRTLEVENAGGMQTLKGSRRRTIGGVFFHLAKAEYPEELSFLFTHRRKRPAPPILDCRLPADKSVKKSVIP